MLLYPVMGLKERLGRSYSRPLLDLSLFAQEVVDFSPQLLGAGLPPARNGLILFNKAVDQRVL